MSTENVEQQAERRPALGVRLAEFFILASMFSFTIPGIVSVWRPFFPSPDYIRESMFIGVFVSCVFSAFSIYFFWFVIDYEEVSKNMKRPKPSKFKILFVKMISPILMFGFGYSLTENIYPMARVVFFGHEVAIRYTVQRADVVPDLDCPRSLVLYELTEFTGSSLCSFPEDLFFRLRPGMEIEFEGWGTEDGLFVKSVRLP